MPKKKSSKKTSHKKPASKKGAPSKTAKKALRTAAEPKARVGKRFKLKVAKATKCCPHCPDYENCKDKGTCCNYCDYYFKGKCMYEKEKDIITRDGSVVVEMNDYRGDDYGIDDYDAYEPLYE